MDRFRRGIKMSFIRKLRQIVDPYNIQRSIRNFKFNDRVIMVSYEKLLDDLEGNMNIVSAFLGSELAERSLYPTANGKNIVVRTASVNTSNIIGNKDRRFLRGITMMDALLIFAGPVWVALVRLAGYVKRIVMARCDWAIAKA